MINADLEFQKAVSALTEMLSDKEKLTPALSKQLVAVFELKKCNSSFWVLRSKCHLDKQVITGS